MISLHYTSDRVIRFRCANTIIYIQGIPGSYGYRSLEIIYYIEDIQAPTDIYEINVKLDITTKLYFRLTGFMLKQFSKPYKTFLCFLVSSNVVTLPR